MAEIIISTQSRSLPQPADIGAVVVNNPCFPMQKTVVLNIGQDTVRLTPVTPDQLRHLSERLLECAQKIEKEWDGREKKYD